MATHPSILVWKISRTEEPGRLQSVGATGVEHDLASKPPHMELWSYDFSRFLWIPTESLFWTAAQACRLVTSEPLFPSVGPGACAKSIVVTRDAEKDACEVLSPGPGLTSALSRLDCVAQVTP